MANEDILLTVGISLESIKKAKQQLISEIAQIKVPDVGGIDEKAMKATIRSLKEVAKESESIGKNIKKPQIFDANTPVLISKAARAIDQGVTSTYKADEAMKKLAATSSYYTEIAKTEGNTVAKLTSERNAYYKVVAQGIPLDEKSAARLKEVESLRQKMGQSAQVQKLETPKAEEYMKANQQLENLAKNTAYYTEKNKIMGTTLNSVGSELNAYLKVQADGIQLDGVALKRKEALTAEYAKLAKAQKGFFHGIDLGRLLLWAVGWKVIYGAMNIVLNSFGEVFTMVGKVNEVILQARIVNQQTAQSFTKDYSNMRKSLFEFAKNSPVSVIQLAEAFRTLTYEGAKLNTAMAALPNVRNLMTITGEKEKVVAQALIETYGLFGDKVRSAGTESAKLTRITDILTAVFTKAHISLSEYQNIMGFIAPMGAEAAGSFEFLAGMLIFADAQMLGGRRAGMALMETLIGLTENTGKLSEVFGITFKPGEMITVEKVLNKIRYHIKDLSDPQKRYLLSNIFKGSSLEVILSMLKETNEQIVSLTDKSDDLGEKLKQSFAEAHPALNALQNGLKEAAKIASDILEHFEKIADKMTKITEAAKRTQQKQFEAMNRTPKQQREFDLIGKKGLESNTDFAKSPLGTSIGFGKDQLATLKESQELYSGNNEKVKEMAKNVKEMVKAEFTYTYALKNQLALLDKKQQLAIDEAAGASFSYLNQQRMNIALEESVSWIEDESKKQKIINEVLSLKETTAKNIYDVFAKNIDIHQHEKEILASTNAILAEKYALQVKMTEEIKTLADDLQSKTTDFVKNMMAGTGNIKDFVKGISDSFRDTFANNLVQMFGEKSGVFASMAGTFMSPLQKAHYGGIKSAAPLIIKAHVDGITKGFKQARGQGGEAGQGASGVGQFGSMTGFMGNVGSIFGGQKGAQTATVSSMRAAGGSTQVPIKPAGGGFNMAAAGRAGGQALGAAGAIYGGYQGVMAQKGQGAGGGALGGALSGAMAGSMFGVWGMVIGAVVGGVLGAIQGKKKNDGSPEIKTQTIEITSRLNISNKELQLANRNLEGIKRGVEAFAFSRSAYFSESRSAEEFASNRVRGYIG